MENHHSTSFNIFLRVCSATCNTAELTHPLRRGTLLIAVGVQDLNRLGAAICNRFQLTETNRSKKIYLTVFNWYDIEDHHLQSHGSSFVFQVAADSLDPVIHLAASFVVFSSKQWQPKHHIMRPCNGRCLAGPSPCSSPTSSRSMSIVRGSHCHGIHGGNGTPAARSP